VTQVIECLLSKDKTMSSSPVLPKRERERERDAQEVGGTLTLYWWGQGRQVLSGSKSTLPLVESEGVLPGCTACALSRGV
jgi:hypothetical protein